jgi:thioredoxin 1
MVGEKVLSVTKENFNEEVLSSDIPVLVDFWASWCGPCRMVAPVLDELAEDFDGKAKIAKINVDEQRELAEQYRVMSIPAIFLFKNGEVVDKTVGAKPKDEFASMINVNL